MRLPLPAIPIPRKSRRAEFENLSAAQVMMAKRHTSSRSSCASMLPRLLRTLFLVEGSTERAKNIKADLKLTRFPPSLPQNKKGSQHYEKQVYPS